MFMLLTSDLNTWVSLIGSLGFPIVVCLIVMVFVRETINQNREQIKDMTESHKLEIEHITDALNNNTLAIQRMCDTFSREEI